MDKFKFNSIIFELRRSEGANKIKKEVEGNTLEVDPPYVIAIQEGDSREFRSFYVQVIHTLLLVLRIHQVLNKQKDAPDNLRSHSGKVDAQIWVADNSSKPVNQAEFNKFKIVTGLLQSVFKIKMVLVDFR